MNKTVIMPHASQTMEEGKVVKWHKAPGDPVSKGEVLLDVETDKAVVEIESMFNGTVIEILVPEGETVPVETPIATIGESD